MRIKVQKAWSITAKYPDWEVKTVVYAGSLQKAFAKFCWQWHMDEVQEISITEVTDDERSKGIPGADSEG